MNIISKLWVEKTWIGLISNRLERFRWVDKDVANFRCPICGDSRKSNSKTRGYFFAHNDCFVFKCHNACGSMSFASFLEYMFPEDYKEYRLDLFKESQSLQKLTEKSESAEGQYKPVMDHSKSKVDEAQFGSALSDLPHNHDAVQYVRDRKLPIGAMRRIYYTDNFRESVLKLCDKRRYQKLPRDKRILLPLRTRAGKIFALQGRRIYPGKAPKYITIKFNDSIPKIFGLDRINENDPVLVVEGPIDSLFLPNCVAICGADVKTTVSYLKADEIYLLLDNEPRHPDTLKRMKVAIETGHHVMFWPKGLSKDINDMVKEDGLSSIDILKIIAERSRQGIAARAEFKQWAKFAA